MEASPWQKLVPLMDLAAPWAVRVVATLRIPDLVAGGVTRLEELAERCSADREMLGRVMSFLTARGVFEEPEPGSYTLTPLGSLLQENAGIRAWLDLDGFGGRMAQAWPGLLESVRTGKPCYTNAFGISVWEDLGANPRIAESFDALMVQLSESLAPSLAEIYDWSRVRELVDVGGGSGTLAAALVRAHPHLRATVLDLSTVEREAVERFAREGIAERCRFQAGSLFDPLPPGAGAYLLSNVIGDWNDESVVAILRRCAEAAGASGRVLIVDSLLEADPASNTSMDLIRLSLSEGRARTEEQLRALLGAAGLELVENHSISGGLCLLECAAPTPEERR